MGEGRGEGFLTYCLNIHPGESWNETYDAIRTHARAVRDRVAPGRPFGLGLRLSAAAAQTLSEPGPLQEFAAFLREEQLCPFTVNAFPFGAFHGTRVKEQVYRPDWRSAARSDYTRACARILAGLLPERCAGSISTVPVGYAGDFYGPNDRMAAIDRLLEMSQFLARLESETGRYVHLGLEPEPGCVLETCEETIAFFESLFARAGDAEPAVRRHVGVCLDTCHAALAFERPLESWARYDDAGILVSKIQLSAALEVEGADPRALRPFVEPVYLHQVRLTERAGRRWMFGDLDEALAAWPVESALARIHFHVPLFWAGEQSVRSTSAQLDAAFWNRVASSPDLHVEIETYTFDVLPAELRAGTVVDSIVREFAWVRERLAGRGSP